MKKMPLPVLRTDEEAEEFVANSDLTQYDLSGGVRTRYRFEEPPSTLLPSGLLEAARTAAAQEGIDYREFIRRAVEKAIDDQAAALENRPA